MQKLWIILVFISIGYNVVAAEGPPPLVPRQAIAEKNVKFLDWNEVNYTQIQKQKYPQNERLFLIEAFVLYALYTSENFAKKSEYYKTEEEELSFIRSSLHHIKQIKAYQESKLVNWLQDDLRLKILKNQTTRFLRNVSIKKAVEEFTDNLEPSKEIFQKIFQFCNNEIINTVQGPTGRLTIESLLMDKIYFEIDTICTFYGIVTPEIAYQNAVQMYEWNLDKYPNATKIAWILWARPHLTEKIPTIEPARKRARYR